MEWKDLIKKEVFCKTRNSGVCSGTVIDYNSEDKIIVILDRFNERWFIAIDEILKLKEEKLC